MLAFTYNLNCFSGFVQKSNIVEYESNRSKYIEKGRGKLFEEAVAQMDEFISDPIVRLFRP